MVRLGKAFSDNVTSFKTRWRLPKHEFRGWGIRLTILYGLLIIAFFALLVRLFHLTVVEGAENRNLSEENRVRSVTIHAPRGIIYDRKGVKLTENIDAFRVTGPCKKGAACQIKLVKAADLKTQGNFVPSVYFEKDYLRQYSYPYETSHILGYLAEISLGEVTNPLYVYQDYLVGDWIGRMGLEAVFEKKLRGVNGRELIEVDASGTRLRSLGKIDATAGSDIHLSIDMSLQKVAYEAMGENAGSVVVTNPKTGEILALVSTPSFNANKFETGMSEAEYTSLLKSADKPMFNRAISGVFPPGSTFKIISSVAGLESGKMPKDKTIEDTGVIKIGEFSFANWFFSEYGGKDGLVDMTKAIARSNDIYFYKLGETVGISTLASWGKKLGLGSRTGLELPSEAEGLMPDPVYKQKVRHEDWYTGDSYHVAIGQGDVQATPLQVNRWTSVIANGGKLCNYTLLQLTGSGTHCQNLGLKKDTIDTVTEGMRRACVSSGPWGYQGTGYQLFDFTVTHEELTSDAGSGISRKVPVACKTGTAEIGDADSSTHAWFTVFAPLPQNSDTSKKDTISGDPEIAVTVLVEKGGQGSVVAAPVAKKILEEYFKR